MFATEFSQRVFWTLDRPDTVRSLLIFKLPPFLQWRSVWILQVIPHNFTNIAMILWSLTSSYVIARQLLMYSIYVKVVMKGLFESFMSSPLIAKMKYGAYEVCKLQHSLALRRFLPLLPFSINIDGQASLIWKLFTARITHWMSCGLKTPSYSCSTKCEMAYSFLLWRKCRYDVIRVDCR